MKKPKNCGELSFLLGAVTLALGTALMRKAGFGMSMVVAPAYVLSAWIRIIPAGTMCYICQGFLVAVTSIMMRRFRVTYLFSFLSAVIFGLFVDLFGFCLSPVTDPAMAMRLLLEVIGIPVNALGVALLFHTYFPPQAPELFVKELSKKTGWQLYRVKYAYDLSSCALSIALSFLLLGHWDWSILGVGTLVVTFVNSPLIALWGKLLEHIAEYRPAIRKIGALFENR